MPSFRFGGVKLKDSDISNDLRTTASVIRQVAETHLGLGQRVAFLQAVNIGELGCVQIGAMGTGKTTCLNAIQKITEKALGTQRPETRKKSKVRKTYTQGRFDWKLITEEFTLASIDERINALFTDSRVTWFSKDLAKLSPTVQENMLKVASSLLYDHECIVSTSTYGCNIQNSRISWFGACTYEIFNVLIDSYLWRGMYQDRIIRYHVFQFAPRDINTDIPTAEMTLYNWRDEPPEVPHDDSFEEIVKMLEGQLTYERSILCAEKLLQGMAIMNKHKGKEAKVVPAHAKFLLLHRFNLEAESYIAWRNTISSPLILDTDVLLILSEAIKRNGVKVPFLVDKYHTDEDRLLDDAAEAPELVRIVDGHTIKPTKNILQFIMAQNLFEKWCLKNG